MTKFNERNLGHFPMAFFYNVVQAFVARTGAIESTLERFLAMKAELGRLFQAFDEAYRKSLKSQLTKTISDLDKVRDRLAFVMENVAKLWATKLQDDTLNIHGRRIAQVFKDFDFRSDEALVAENAKIHNIEQVFAQPTLAADLEAIGLTELNRRFAETTAQIEQLMSQRNEEQSAIVTGELRRTRDALDQHIRAMITYLNAVQELQPEESISLAAQYYNQDLQKAELQLAQSRRSGTSSTKPASDAGSGADSGDSGGTSTDGSGSSGDSGSSGNSGSGGSGNSGDSGNSGSGGSGNSGDSGNSGSGSSGNSGDSGNSGSGSSGGSDPDNGDGME